MINVNNQITLEGSVLSLPIFDHETKGESFFCFEIKTNRLSENFDTLKVTISDRLLTIPLNVGDEIKIEGGIRTYNKFVDGINKLLITVFANRLVYAFEKSNNPNEVMLEGFICKAPVNRCTPMGREITDILIAVNRAYNKSDYIPLVIWGRNAEYIKDYPVGTKIHVTGRLQSRSYQKKAEDGITNIPKIAYEVSVSLLNIVTKIVQEQVCSE